MLLQLFSLTPDILFTSPAFPTTVRAAMAALTLVQADVIFAALDFIGNVVTHDCLVPSSSPPPKFPVYAAAIRSVLDKEGLELSSYVLSGLTGEFPEESTSIIVTIFRRLATFWSSQLLTWLPTILQRLSPTSVPDQAKSDFMTEMIRSVSFAHRKI